MSVDINYYPEVTTRFTVPDASWRFEQDNFHFKQIFEAVFALLPDERELTYNFFENYVNHRSSWNGPWVSYCDTPKIRVSFKYCDMNMRLRLWSEDHPDSADIYVRSRAPLGVKEWLIRFEGNVFCPDEQTIVPEVHLNRPLISSDELFAPSVVRKRNLLRAYCFHKV